MLMDTLYRGTPEGLMQRLPIRLRDATSADLEALSDLCRRSKAVWGYDQAFLDACADELNITYDDLLSKDVKVALQGDHIIGVASLELDGDEAELGTLFIDPEWMGCGAGRVLLDWACTTARGYGVKRLTIDSDPNAEGFYARMGARKVGWAPSHSLPGRMLPMMQMEL